MSEWIHNRTATHGKMSKCLHVSGRYVIKELSGLWFGYMPDDLKPKTYGSTLRGAKAAILEFQPPTNTPA